MNEHDETCGINGPCDACRAAAEAQLHAERGKQAQTAMGILRAARKRYHRLPIYERPALDCGPSAVCLFQCEELIALVKAGLYPLSPKTISWMKTAPSKTRRRKRRSFEEQLADFVARRPDLWVRLLKLGGATHGQAK